MHEAGGPEMAAFKICYKKRNRKVDSLLWLYGADEGARSVRQAS